MVSRRNLISRGDEQLIRVIAAVSGVIAAFSGAAPTGTRAVDVVLVAGFSAFVAWIGASTVWWALVATSGLAVAATIGGPVIVFALAALSLAASTALGWNRMNQPVVRAAIAGVVVQVLLRLHWDPTFFASGLLAGVGFGLLMVTGVLRRRSHIRQRIYWIAGGLGVAAGLAVGALIVSALGAREPARDGYLAMLDGLESIQSGDTLDAAARLRAAAAHLDDASDALGGTLSQPARLVPVVAQNRNAATGLLSRAADAADAAASTLEVVDLSSLTVQDGVVNIAAFAALEAPLTELEATILELDEALRDADSPWLVAPFAERLDSARERARQVVPQARATAEAARTAPAMLGADGQRRYFIAFVNNAEARGVGGLMGNWNEITIDDGRLEVTATGRTAELQSNELGGLQLRASEEYFERYDFHGARDGMADGVNPKFWSNVTFPPDMPSVGSPISQMYEAVTGRRVDGVIVIDPAGVAQLLEVTGPVQLDTIDRRIDARNAERFLQLEQYDYAESEREDFLAEVTDKTIGRVLSGNLPPPQRLAPILADAALNGHISGWAERQEEQALVRMVGMDNALPVITEAGVDGFAVTNINTSGNKIENFLERNISYQATVDEESGDVVARLRVHITNTAPTSGYPNYVIGNIIGDRTALADQLDNSDLNDAELPASGSAEYPVGTNRMLIDIHTILEPVAARVDGELFSTRTQPELGYYVWTTVATLEAGESMVLELDLVGNIGPGGYRLVYRPQALPRRDQLALSATTTWGRSIFDFEGRLERRTVLSRERLEAWRSPASGDS